MELWRRVMSIVMLSRLPRAWQVGIYGWAGVAVGWLYDGGCVGRQGVGSGCWVADGAGVCPHHWERTNRE